DALVDRLAFEHPFGFESEEVEQLELAPGEVHAAARGEDVVDLRAQLQLAGAEVGAGEGMAGAAGPAGSLDPGEDLGCRRRLGDPVLGSGAQAAQAGGEGAAAGADQDAEAGDLAGDLLEAVPEGGAESVGVEQDRVDLGRLEGGGGQL